MILPTKFIEEEDTLLQVGIDLLEILGKQLDIAKLWQEAKDIPSIATYERFILGLDLLFCFGLIDIENNLLMRKKLC
ncbi:ABC-three component system middle component 6 [Rickettsia endosymbiont of Pantilius tunicatus]|uniref:ABC-three component system middle component 6 n=1 Tax=unclassified Rickettsia TaxID=114295 RepID=UPI0030DF07D4